MPNTRGFRNAAPPRMTAALLALALTLPAAGQESAPPDAPPLRVEAERIENEGTRTRASGAAKAHFEEYTLCAAELVYDRDTGIVQAIGEVRLLHGDGELTGESASAMVHDGTGEVRDFSAALADGALYISGARAQWMPAGMRAAAVSITSCPPESEDWRLVAGEVRTRRETQDLLVRDATLQIGGVPLLYLPRADFYYGEAKRSGFLPPAAGIGTDSGTGISAPYYVLLADNYDLTLTPRYRSRHGLELGGEFRFLTEHSRGDIALAAVLYDDSGRGRERVNYHYENGPWRATLTAENVSDSDYLRDYGDDDDALSVRNLPRRAALRYERDGFFAAAALEHFKTLDDALTAPHRALPLLEVGGDGGGDDYDWQASWQYARFRHNTLDGGARHVWRGGLRATRHIGGVALSPGIGAHAARVRADGAGNGNDATFIVPYARLDAEQITRQPFAAVVGDVGGHDHLRLRAALVYAPVKRAQLRAPLFDTEARTQTPESLFEQNRFVGGDRASDARFLAYGASYYLFAGAAERFYIGAAQRYHFAHAQIALPSGDAPPQQGFGNVLVNSRLRLQKNWLATANAEWNTDQKTFDHFHAELQGALADNKLVHLRYRADEDESLVAGFGMPLTDGVELAMKTDYLMDKDRFARSEAALRLTDGCGCWSISFAISDTVVQQDDNETRFSIGVHLFGLGNIGGDYDSLLNKLR